MPSLSVVIPCYNAMPYIKRVIDSVLTQSYKYIDWVEMIIVDDCSTDDSCEYVEKMAREASSINEKVRIDLVRRQENSGNGALPRNDGILRAKGDYLFLIDSDDWFSPDSLDRMVRHAVEWNSDILLCKPTGENGREVPQAMFHKSDPTVDIYTSNAFNKLSNLNLYRTKFLQDNQILNPDNGRTPAEDWSFMFRAYLQAKTISIAADYVYYHVLNRGNDSHLSAQLIALSYTSDQWHIFWKQLFTDIDKYADLSKIYFRIIPRLANAQLIIPELASSIPLVLKMLYDMFSGYEPPENFIPIISLWNKWFNLERMREDNGNIIPEHSIIIQAARTENVEIIRAAHDVVNLYKASARFPDEYLTVNPDRFAVSLEHSGGTYECDISKEIRFAVKDFTPPRYENGQFNFAARLEDYRSYLSENASIDLIFFDEKNSYREVFPMAKTRISDAELTARCSVDPHHFQSKYALTNIRWDLYVEISSPLLGTRNIRVGNQGNKEAIEKALQDSLISQPFFTFRGYLSPANNIHFRQSPFPTSKITNLSCRYDPTSQKLAMQGMIESVVDFHGDEEVSLIIHSATNKTVLSYPTKVTENQGNLAWQGEFSLTNFLGVEPGSLRWDLSLQVKSPRLGDHSIRLGQQQAEIESLTSSIDALQLTKNGYRLTCYLSAYNNIHFRQVPISSSKVADLVCAYEKSSQKLSLQGTLESGVAFHGDEEVSLIIHSATNKTVLAYLAQVAASQGKLFWSGELSVTDFLGLEPGNLRWDLSLQVKSPRLGDHSIRLGQQQAEIESLTSSIDALQLTKNGYRLKCYLSPYNNIHFRQVPISQRKRSPALNRTLPARAARKLKRIAKKSLTK